MKRFAISPPTLVAALLGCAIVADALTIGRFLLPVRKLASSAPLPVAAHRALSHPLAELSTIVNAHLFGSMRAPVGTEANAPMSHGALLLTATLAMRNPDHGFAVIVETGRPGQLYAVGASVGAGAMLRRVYPDHVILDRGGVLEKLELRKPVGGTAVAAVAPTQLAAVVPAGEPRAGASPFIRLQSVTLMPVFGDASRGARIAMPRNPMEFRKTGLRAGDIITAINGTPVHSAQAAADQLRAANGGALNLTVQRDGQTQTLQVESLE